MYWDGVWSAIILTWVEVWWEVTHCPAPLLHFAHQWNILSLYCMRWPGVFGASNIQGFWKQPGWRAPRNVVAVPWYEVDGPGGVDHKCWSNDRRCWQIYWSMNDFIDESSELLQWPKRAIGAMLVVGSVDHSLACCRIRMRSLMSDRRVRGLSWARVS